MKDSLLEMLMDFFEKTLAQIKETSPDNNLPTSVLPDAPDFDAHLSPNKDDNQNQILRQRRKKSIRVFTAEEQLKFTKASYQFMVRILRFDLIAAESMEEIINQLLLSDSPFVTLEETKWTIRNTLAARLDPKQLAFLDLVLYQKEDRLALH